MERAYTALRIIVILKNDFRVNNSMFNKLIIHSLDILFFNCFNFYFSIVFIKTSFFKNICIVRRRLIIKRIK